MNIIPVTRRQGNCMSTDSPMTQTTPIRVFIVEDYYLIRMGLISALEEFPNLKFVGEAESAEDALVQLAATETDILILDLGLPGMNGIEMAHEVRTLWPHIKIVILTSHNQPEEVLAALGAGAQAYALKDIKPNRLAQVIETVYEGAAWLDPAIASVVLYSLAESPADTTRPGEQKQASTPGNPGLIVDLTEREREVLQLIVKGKNNQEISELLHISIHTTKAHVGNILGKLCVNDRVQAAIKAINERLV
jgi:DNA-binding NarL/FixJ family response regulator